MSAPLIAVSALAVAAAFGLVTVAALRGIGGTSARGQVNRARLRARARSLPEGNTGGRGALLVAILADPHARDDERDDAAMDLEFYSGPLAESALADTIRNEGFSSVLAQTCAESLAGIWAREGRIDEEFLKELRGQAKEQVITILSARAPHLIPG